MNDMIHYFEEFDTIKVSGSTATFRDEIRILCGAEEGEADNRNSKVTCPDCKEALKERQS